MAIEDLGSSLLSDVRERKNEQYEQYKKDQRDISRTIERKERQAKLISFGLNTLVDIGNRVVAKKTQDFLTTENQLNNSAMIKSADTFAQDYQKIDSEIKKYNGTGADYFATQVTPTVQKYIDSKYDYTYSTADKSAAVAALAMNYGESLYEAHESNRKNYEKLIAGDINFQDYKKELYDLQPKTMVDAFKTKAASLFSKGEDVGISSARMMGMLDVVEGILDDDGDGVISKEEKENAFYDVYKKTKNNSLTALEIQQTYEDLGIENIKKAKAIFGKPESYATLNDFGDEVNRSMQEVTVNGVSHGWVDVQTGDIIKSINGESKDTYKKVSNIKPETLRAIQTKVNSIIDNNADMKDAFASRLKTYTGDAKGEALKDRLIAGQRQIFGSIQLTSNKLQREYGITDSNVSMQIATHMHGLNYQWIKENDGFGEEGETDLTMSVMPNMNWNSHLALAAIYDIEQNNKFIGRVQLNDVEVDGEIIYGLRTKLLAKATDGSEILSAPQIVSLWGDVNDAGSGGFLGQGKFKGMPNYINLQNNGVNTIAKVHRNVLRSNTPKEEIKPAQITYTEDEMDQHFKWRFRRDPQDLKLALGMDFIDKQSIFNNTGGAKYIDEIRKTEKRKELISKGISKIGQGIKESFLSVIEKQKLINSLEGNDKLLYQHSSDKDAFLINYKKRMEQ